MKIFKDKKGNKLTSKEYFTRWREGIENTTPLQKIKIQIVGTRITLLGLFLGLLVSIYGWKNLWWVGIILIGALLNTGVQYLGLKQQKKILDDLEKQFKEPEEEIIKPNKIKEKDSVLVINGKGQKGIPTMAFKLGKQIKDKIKKEKEVEK